MGLFRDLDGDARQFAVTEGAVELASTLEFFRVPYLLKVRRAPLYNAEEHFFRRKKTMRIQIQNKLLALGLLTFSAAVLAKADVIVYVGYYDLAPPAGGNTGALPNPWIGSPNTTFLGSSSEATSSDPDESAIRLTNTGTTAVTLSQGFTVTSGASSFTLWDSLIGAGGFSILPGQTVILSGTTANGFDGSDIGLTNSTISFTLNGTAFSVVDSNSILNGSPIGSANETEPWTQIGDLLGSNNPSPVPEPSSVLLTSVGTAGLLIGLKRKRSQRDRHLL